MHSFTIKDAEGRPHRYEVMPHAPTDGFRVCSRVAAAVIDPLAGTGLSVLAKTVPAALKRGARPGGKFDMGAVLDSPEIMDSLGALDFSTSGPALRRTVESLDLALVKDILRHANRDGKALDADINFDSAYARNYTELFVAAWKVGLYNRFFGPLDGFGDLARSAMAQAKDALSPDGPPPTG